MQNHPKPVLNIPKRLKIGEKKKLTRSEKKNSPFRGKNGQQCPFLGPKMAKSWSKAEKNWPKPILSLGPSHMRNRPKPGLSTPKKIKKWSKKILGQKKKIPKIVPFARSVLANLFSFWLAFGHFFQLLGSNEGSSLGASKNRHPPKPVSTIPKKMKKW